MSEMIRLKYVSSINEDVLDEDADPGFEFLYVDISAVGQGTLALPAEPTRFAVAPSRARRLAVAGDTVVSTVRTYLRAVTEVPATDGPLVFSTGFAVISPDRRRVYPRYLTWQLQADNFISTVESISAGVSYPATSAAAIGDIGVRIPPLDVQRAVADFLDRETAKIDALIAKQRELTRSALEHRDRLILDLITKGNASEPLVDSGVDWIGTMAQHWETRPLRYVLASVETGVWGSDPTADGGGTNCVRVADFDREQLLVTDPVPTLREVSPEDVRRRGLRRGDLLIERSGGTQANPVGFVVSFESDVEAVCSNFISRMRLGDGMNPRYWLYAFYAARLTRITEKWTKQTTGIQNLDFGGFSSEHFPCPPGHEQDQIARDLDQLMSATQAQLSRLRSLEALLTERRAALITAAVTGQIDVTTYGKGA